MINKLLAKNPDCRYQSLDDVQFDLEPIVLDLRKENIGELIPETRNLIAADQFETAQSVVRQVFEIDPTNRLARELREGIQRQLKDRAVRPQRHGSGNCRARPIGRSGNSMRQSKASNLR